MRILFVYQLIVLMTTTLDMLGEGGGILCGAFMVPRWSVHHSQIQGNFINQNQFFDKNINLGCKDENSNKYLKNQTTLFLLHSLVFCYLFLA